jgi:hypothetical protein
MNISEPVSEAAYGPYALAPRRWDVSTFDLATLFTKHRLHGIPYELMGVFLAGCNMEFSVTEDTAAKAQAAFERLRTMLYVRGCAPFILPYLSTHSLNEYAGINGRDSELLRPTMHEGLREGITSKDPQVEVWPLQLTLQVIQGGDGHTIPAAMFEQAARDTEPWQRLTGSTPALRAVQAALIAAPSLTDMGQSLLHIWTAIESLFPRVDTEVSFRVALHLAQLAAPEVSDRQAYFTRVRKAYGVRSRVAHGNTAGITGADWQNAWDLLCQACRAIITRGTLPTEDALIGELLTSSHSHTPTSSIED